MSRSTEYVATEPIFIDGIRAFNEGDPVPASHVKDHDLGDKVAHPGTKAAEKATSPSDTTV